MFEIPNQSENLNKALHAAFEMATISRDEFITPEHLLWAIAHQPQYMLAFGHETAEALLPFIEKHVPLVPDDAPYETPELSVQFQEMLNCLQSIYIGSSTNQIDVPHIIQAIFMLEGSFANDVLMQVCHGDKGEFLSRLIESYSEDPFADADPDFPDDLDIDWEELESGSWEDIGPTWEGEPQGGKQEKWKQYVTCLNDLVATHNPLIGRADELDRTIQVLCRKDKNNPLHVGEAGVGKTALAYGLAQRIVDGLVPECLAGCQIYEIDMGTLIAGTQYRGEFEKRFKAVLEGVKASDGKAILYIDEIHTAVGAGKVEGGTLDASNLLKRYLDMGSIRIMGATTYDEYNRAFVNSKAFGRRFEKIDIPEPTIEECQKILDGLKEAYENFHHVTFTPEAIEFAVTGSAKYITGRYLPDKAIDLIDEAGAWRQLHPDPDAEEQIVDKKLIAEALARICHVDTLADNDDDKLQLQDLEARILEKIYGQDKAVHQLAEAVMMGSAGLIDDNKPLASLLFVGPTGVGKTEVARVLADELHVPLIRFDMSEYAEKHSVAKLIGSPAGYVGYDDGGQLTDAIRKTPHCVLLFDELEKAHPDIYNILLQVMDYAVLTDNKGQKADFRHVVFIMTTNSGAQYAHFGGTGFVKGGSAGHEMLKAVKQTFKPEFLNRLTDITIFNDMDQHMTRLILNKKLALLSAKLAAKSVKMTLTDAAMEWLLKEGFSEKYGGREIDRVLTSSLKPLLMRQILFGSLRNGGEALIDYQGEKLVLI